MTRLDELHQAYMREKDIDNDFEAQQLNDYYCCTEDDIVELVDWHPVAKDKEKINFNFLSQLKKEK